MSRQIRWKYKDEQVKSTERIDGAVAVVMALIEPLDSISALEVFMTKEVF